MGDGARIEAHPGESGLEPGTGPIMRSIPLADVQKVTRDLHLAWGCAMSVLDDV